MAFILLEATDETASETQDLQQRGSPQESFAFRFPFLSPFSNLGREILQL